VIPVAPLMEKTWTGELRILIPRIAPPFILCA
jgi:hypothetical protein